MLRVGLTGGIGAGKSTVARLLAEHGAVVIDADALARQVVETGTPGLAAIVERFGPGVLRPDGSLDREALGRIVFADPQARRDLEQITHPRIAEETVRLSQAAEQAGAPALVHDVPLLVEKGMAPLYDAVVVVEAPDEVRLARLEGRGLPREQARERMRAQASSEQRRAVATHVVDNAGSADDLRRRVDEVWASMTA